MNNIQKCEYLSPMFFFRILSVDLSYRLDVCVARYVHEGTNQAQIEYTGIMRTYHIQNREWKSGFNIDSFPQFALAYIHSIIWYWLFFVAACEWRSFVFCFFFLVSFISLLNLIMVFFIDMKKKHNRRPCDSIIKHSNYMASSIDTRKISVLPISCICFYGLF